MDKETSKQLEIVIEYFSRWFQDGPKVWDFNYKNRLETVKLNTGNTMSVENMYKMAIDAKRHESYDIAISFYMRILAEHYETFRTIPVIYVRGLFKVLMCTNSYQLAYKIISTIVGDMQHYEDIDPMLEQMLWDYWKRLNLLSIEVVDNGKYDLVKAFSAEFAGNSNYEVIATKKDIMSDLNFIRTFLRNTYGK